MSLTQTRDQDMRCQGVDLDTVVIIRGVTTKHCTSERHTVGWKRDKPTERYRGEERHSVAP